MEVEVVGGESDKADGEKNLGAAYLLGTTTLAATVRYLAPPHHTNSGPQGWLPGQGH